MEAKKLTITEGMSVDYVKQHGNKAQQVAARFFDADDSGDFKGNEVELFNSCVFNMDEKTFTVYDKELQSEGHGGIIVFNLLKDDMYNYSYEDLQIAFEKTKYAKDSSGYRHLGEQDEYHYGDLCYHKKLASFDKVEFNFGKYADKLINAKGPWYSRFIDGINTVLNKIPLPTPRNEEREEEWMQDRQELGLKPYNN